MERKHTKFAFLLAAMLILVMALAGCSEPEVPVDSATALKNALAAEGTQTIAVNEPIVLTEPLVVNGEKTIVGSGSITLSIADAGTGEEAGGAISLLGCSKLTAEDMSADPAVLQVQSGASLTLGGSVAVDGTGTVNGVLALGGATVNLTESAAVQNGKGCGIYVCENAVLNVSGGSVLTSAGHGVVNLGTMNVSGGTLSGAEKGAVVYSAGTLDISGGVIAEGSVHNVYVAAGSAAMTGGKIEWADKDGFVVAAGASANVTGGTIENCGTHGLCNNGTMETGAVTLTECGIANNAGGILNMVDTTVDISAVYCLANLGGTVTAKNFSALSCDVTAICNFSGDMTLEDLTVDGSRAGCISNESGNLTVNGATLGLCREKPINVGSGVVKMDNITVEGTTGEYFGAYIYGGEFYLSNSTISYINYSALRADGQCYVELNNVSVDDTMASGIWSRGATIVANNLTLSNIRGHAINNSGGTVTITGLTATDIGKNAILQNNGTTTLNNVSFLNVGDQGAYVENGKLIINGGSFENVAQNGVYSRPDGTSEVELTDVTYTNITKYGLNNGYKMSAKNVTINKTGETGILNKYQMSLSSVDILSPAKDCIYNDATGIINAVDVYCYNSGYKSNPVYNRGIMAVYGMYIHVSNNHGLYNLGSLCGNGLTIRNVKKMGIYNVGGTVDGLDNLTILETGDHAINNREGEFTASNLTISEVQGEKANAIYNTGTMNLTGVNVDGGNSHSIFNKGSITGSDFIITNSADVSYYNNENGYSDITNLTVTDSGNHAICNISEMKLTNATVTNTKSGNGIYNNKGALELNGTVSLTGCVSHGLCNNEGAISGAADVTVVNAAGNGIYNNKGEMTLGTASINGANYGFSNSGTAGIAALTVEHTNTNAVHNSRELAVNGDVVISDVYGATSADNNGNGIYNTGTMTVGGGLQIDKITAAGHNGNSANNAIFNRGALTVNGSVTIGDVAAGHAILGTAGSIEFPGTVTVNGTVGKDNIIYLYSSAKTAAFGKLVKTSDTAKVILKADGSAQVTVGAGELVAGSGKDVVIANGSAVVTLNNTAITGGNNALYAAGGTIIAENVTVTNAKYAINSRSAATSKVVLKGTVKLLDGTNVAVYVQNGSTLEIADGADVTISTSGTGRYNAVMLNASGSTLKMGAGSRLNIEHCNYAIHTVAETVLAGDPSSAITITDTKDTAVYLQGTGTLGSMSITGTGKYGLSVAGTANIRLTALNIDGVKNNAIHNVGVLNVTGDVSIANVTGESTGDDAVNGIYNTKTLTIGGDLNIGANTAAAEKNSSGNGIFNRGTLTVAGSASIGDAPCHAVIATAGSMEIAGELTVNGSVGKEHLLNIYGTATVTIAKLTKTSDVDKIVLKAGDTAVVTVNGGTVNGGSKNVIVTNNTATINVSGMTINGGNSALIADGGNIVASGVAVNGSTIGINVNKAGSAVTIRGTCSITDAAHGTSVHVKDDGKLIVDGGSLNIAYTGEGKVGIKVYAKGTLELIGGNLTITGAKMGMNVEGTVNGDGASSITITNVSADSYAIDNKGTITMYGTVTASGAASKYALYKTTGNMTVGTLNRPDTTAREVFSAEGSAQVTINGGTINGGSGKDVIVARGTSVLNVSNVTINGGNNAIYGAGGNINAANVTINGSTYGINVRNAASVVTLNGTNTISNSPAAADKASTCIHVNSGGKMVIAKDASLTVQWTEESLKNIHVGMKIYNGSTVIMEDNASLSFVNCAKGWNTESGYIFTRSETAAVTVNGVAQ